MKNLIITTLCVLLASTTVLAIPTQVTYTDGPQDLLFVPVNVHELGTGADFPQDELIFATDTLTNETVCFDPATPDDFTVPNTLVSMRNLTGIAWGEVWYVADWDETTHSNYDGWVSDGAVGVLPGTAFRIDSKVTDPFGIHNPLVFESMTPDGIFEPFETWDFVIQDYSNTLFKAASALGSIGVPSAIFTSDASSGSIIAVPVPEPATLSLLALSGLLLRRKK